MLHTLLLSMFILVNPADANDEKEPSTSEIETKIGAQIVLRPEFLFNPSSATPAEGAQGVVRQGVRLSAALKRGPLSVLAQFQDVRNWGTETSGLSIDPLAGLHQGYVQYETGSKKEKWFQLRIGRQEIRVANGRFIAESPWQPAGRAYDGLRAKMRNGDTEAELFVAMTKTPNRFSVEVDDTTTSVSSPGDWLTILNLGQYFGQTTELRGGMITLHQRQTEDKPTFGRDVIAPYLHLNTEPIEGLSLKVDTMVQAGSLNDRQHFAWMAGTRLKYTVKKMEMKPSVVLMYEQSSGEPCSGEYMSGANCSGDKSQAFFPFYGRNHYFRGIADRVGGINVRDFGAGIGIKPTKGLSVGVDWHHFQLVDLKGAWYRNNGTVVGWDENNTQSGIGHEIDIRSTYKLKKMIFIQSALTVFQPVGAGAAWTGTGPQVGAYVWTRFTL